MGLKSLFKTAGKAALKTTPVGVLMELKESDREEQLNRIESKLDDLLRIFLEAAE